MKKDDINWIEKYEKLKEVSGREWAGKINKITPMTNKEYFGDEGVFGEKDGIELEVTIEDPKNKDFKETFTQWISIPTSFRGVEKSHMYLFEQRYGERPKEDLIVNVVLDDNNFFRIVL